MEQNPAATAITIDTTVAVGVAGTPAPAPLPPKNKVEKDLKNGGGKKKRGPMQLIRVALFMLRRQSGGKSKNSVQAEVATKGMLKKVVGSMRPLHLQDNQSPPPALVSIPSAPALLSPPSPTFENFEDVFPPPGPYSPSSSSSRSGDMSRYASAQNLQELDRSDDGDECDELAGDAMIDAKAEEFIAQFYKQIRLQRMDSIDRYNAMIARSMH